MQFLAKVLFKANPFTDNHAIWKAEYTQIWSGSSLVWEFKLQSSTMVEKEVVAGVATWTCRVAGRGR
jgi:hypothetical protein